MIFIRIAGVEVIAGIFHHNGFFARGTKGKLYIGPLDLHEAPPIWSGELRRHSHAVKHLVNRSATIVATRDLQVQLLIPCRDHKI